MPHSDPRGPQAKPLSKTSRLRRAAGRLLRALGLAGTAGLAAVAAPAAAQQAPATIPQHWLSYAELVSNQFQAWLSDPANETVVRLHTWMQDRMLQEGTIEPPPPLIVRVWVDPTGQVSRLEFASLGQAQADADLRSLLIAEPLSEPPPPDMRQPMVLQLVLSFAGP